MIEWCNSNQGFINVILSFLTLTLSCIAIFVSIRTARLPYKKRLKITSGWEYSESGFGLHITAINTGNRAITISMIGLLIENKQYILPEQIGNSQQKILPTDNTSQHFLLTPVKEALIQQRCEKSIPVFAYVIDTEGEEYTHKMGIVHDIISD